MGGDLGLLDGELPSVNAEIALAVAALSKRESDVGGSVVGDDFPGEELGSHRRGWEED